MYPKNIRYIDKQSSSLSNYGFIAWDSKKANESMDIIEVSTLKNGWLEKHYNKVWWLFGGNTYAYVLHALYIDIKP